MTDKNKITWRTLNRDSSGRYIVEPFSILDPNRPRSVEDDETDEW